MCSEYILEWLDALVTVTLNPAKSTITTVAAESVRKLSRQITEETDKIQSQIKCLVFNQQDEEKIRCSIKNYYESLTTLLRQAIINKNSFSKPALLKQVLEMVVANIDELIALIEDRFSNYLSPDEYVPSTYLIISQKEIGEIFKELELKFTQQDNAILTASFGVFAQEMGRFLHCTISQNIYSFKDISYYRQLCMEALELPATGETELYSPFDQLLLSANFNSKGYTTLLVNRIMTDIQTAAEAYDNTDRLYFYLKFFKQLGRRTGLKFDNNSEDLLTQICNWINQEIAYLEKIRYSTIILPQPKTDSKAITTKEKQKILVSLSVDQIGLILRAADEMKIIMARSLNSVFKNIVPYLSTNTQETISPDSMRSKSYAAELRDKEVVIHTLQQMIAKVKDF